jgi:predicted DNA-binding transcriptional regulator YafY
MGYVHDYDKILTRLTLILSKLYRGEALDKKELASEFNVSERTIYRDFKERLISFPIYQDSDKRWRMSKEFALDKSLTLEDEISLCILQDLSKQMGDKFSMKIDKLFDRLKNDNCHPIYTKLDMEDMSGFYENIEIIESAIKDKKVINIRYSQSEENSYIIEVKPLRVASFDGFWYLVALDHKDRVKKYYFKAISDIKIDKKEFVLNKNIIEVMQESINIWFELDTKFEVVLQANHNIAKYFIRKPISSTQKILEKKEDGSIVLTLQITSMMEIKNHILKYLPDLIILSPKWLDQEIKEKFIKPYLTI